MSFKRPTSYISVILIYYNNLYLSMLTKLPIPTEPIFDYLDSTKLNNKIVNSIALGYLAREDRLREIFSYLNTPHAKQFLSYLIEVENCKISIDNITIPNSQFTTEGLRINTFTKNYSVNFLKSGYDVYQGFSTAFKLIPQQMCEISNDLSDSIIFFKITDNIYTSLKFFQINMQP